MKIVIQKQRVHEAGKDEKTNKYVSEIPFRRSVGKLRMRLEPITLQNCSQWQHLSIYLKTNSCVNPVRPAICALEILVTLLLDTSLN